MREEAPQPRAKTRGLADQCADVETAPSSSRHRVFARGLVATALVLGVTLFATDRWIDATALPPLTPETSATVLDRDNTLLRAYQVETGLWRLPITAQGVDRDYIAMLLAYEDKRFRDHGGVDLRAMGRAVWSSLKAGRIVSGGSTLTMQVARLLEDAPTRSFRAKLRQVRVALALERQLDKDAILDLYLTLAPFGGNIEGVRAASLVWFGQEPRRLTPAQAALLVALPQSPESRRPDRHRQNARAARDRVLARVVGAGALAEGDARAARTEPVPNTRRPFPRLAPHLADRMVREMQPRTSAARSDASTDSAPPVEAPHLRAGLRTISTTLDATLQSDIETLLRQRATTLGPSISAAAIVADHETGEILASVGSADLMDGRRKGFIDMTRAVRSPGSTLKPLIFGLAFEQGLAHPETLIDDRPTAFGRYAPQNFDRRYYGTVSIRRALHLSLNIPAVAALEGVGPARMIARMRRAGTDPVLPPGDAPGLAIGLGGLGMTLTDLVQLYAGIARGGEPVVLHSLQNELLCPGRRAGASTSGALSSEAPHLRAGQSCVGTPAILTPEAAWQVADILAGAPVPGGAAPDTLAFKTGTSYGHRDAWAVGFDGRHVIGLWFGRPDGAPAPGILGLQTAAPVLFEAFARLKPVPEPLPIAPASVLRLPNAELPQPLRRFRTRSAPVAQTNAPTIAFPPDGARLAWQAGDPLALKVGGGTAPFTWLVDGAPLAADPFSRQVSATPNGPGFLSISVIDARGKAARARVRVE